MKCKIEKNAVQETLIMFQFPRFPPLRVTIHDDAYGPAYRQ